MRKIHVIALFPSLLLASLVAGCGGGDSNTSTAAADSPATPVAISQDAGTKVLLVEADGISFSAVRAALDAHAAAGLDGLSVAPAWTGGTAGGLTEQRTLGRPSWASLITGKWAYRHGVYTDDDAGETLKADTMFAMLKAARANVHIGVAGVSDPDLALLDGDITKGVFDELTNCAGDAACVTARASDMVSRGYDLTVAQLGAAANQPAIGLADVASAVGTLRAQIAQRQKTHPNEKWLVLLTSGYGLDQFGSNSGWQSLDNKTVFIASSESLPSLPGTDEHSVADLGALYQHGAITDIAPTILNRLQVPLIAENYYFDGQNLAAGMSIRPTGFAAGGDKASIALSWSLTKSPANPLKVWRDGNVIATLAADARTFLDTGITAATSGLLKYSYAIQADDALASFPAQLDYVKPVVLAGSLTTGLTSYFPFVGASLSGAFLADARSATSLVPWDSTADGGSVLPADNFLDAWQTQALRVDAAVVGATTGQAGYRLIQNGGGDITGSPQFTVGFWYRVTNVCARDLSSAVPMLSNKLWTSGQNAGITIGLFSGCEVRFNLGSGSDRADATNSHLADGQWVYIALAVDSVNRTASAYLFDPVYGAQITNLSISANVASKVAGLGNGFSLNEDGSGKFYTTKNQPGSPRIQADYNDIGLWNRLLTADEVRSIYASGRPVSTLLP